jgi:hypothetical protein
MKRNQQLEPSAFHGIHDDRSAAWAGISRRALGSRLGDVGHSPSVKPRLAIASNYDDSSCGIAAYTRVREEALAQFFDVTVFDLRSARILRPPGRRREATLRLRKFAGFFRNST